MNWDEKDVSYYSLTDKTMNWDEKDVSYYSLTDKTMNWDEKCLISLTNAYIDSYYSSTDKTIDWDKKRLSNTHWLVVIWMKVINENHRWES